MNSPESSPAAKPLDESAEVLAKADTTEAALAARSTIVKTPDHGRYCSSNIRLSVALCALGFILRDDAEPATRVAELYFRKRKTCRLCQRGDYKHDHVDVAFFHCPTPIADAPITKLKNSEDKPLVFSAIDIEAWWRFPGKFSIPGFDDALNAIRRVLEAREWLLCVVHGARPIANQRFAKDSVVTTSIRFASVLKACGFELLAFEKLPGRDNSRFVFPAKAVRIVELIEKCHAVEEDDPDSTLVTHHTALPYSDRRTEGDLCVDWMLWALEYHARLLRKVKAAMLMVEIREKGEPDMPTVSGEHVCRISSEMPKTLRKEFIGHL